LRLQRSWVPRHISPAHLWLHWFASYIATRSTLQHLPPHLTPMGSSAIFCTCQCLARMAPQPLSVSRSDIFSYARRTGKTIWIRLVVRCFGRRLYSGLFSGSTSLCYAHFSAIPIRVIYAYGYLTRDALAVPSATPSPRPRRAGALERRSLKSHLCSRRRSHFNPAAIYRYLSTDGGAGCVYGLRRLVQGLLWLSELKIYSITLTVVFMTAFLGNTFAAHCYGNRCLR